MFNLGRLIRGSIRFKLDEIFCLWDVVGSLQHNIQIRSLTLEIDPYINFTIKTTISFCHPVIHFLIFTPTFNEENIIKLNDLKDFIVIIS